jgi:cell division protein FtsI (penicillin-binding protein 3)
MNSSYKIRGSWLFFIFCVLYGVIVLNLYFIQIVHHQFYAQLQHKQCYITVTTDCARAPVLDRTGKQYLALNKESLAAFILPKNLEDPASLLPFLEQYFPKARERFEFYKNHHFMFVQRRLTLEQQMLLVHAHLADIKLLQEPSRYYPIPGTGPLIGITDIDNQGLCGIEFSCNDRLAGTPATCMLARDARSNHFYFNKETKIPGRQGESVTLTIDATLQFIAYQELQKTVQRLQAQEGAVLIINPADGDILAMVNVPDFDPNQPDTFDLACAKNGIVTNAYELGSVIKVFAALAALEEGVVTLDEIIDCKNTKSTYIDGRKINTVYPGGLLTFSQIIEQSNNIGIAMVAKRLGPALYHHYCRLGFGEKTGIALPGEQKGFINPPDNWSKQSIISLSYGYEIRATLLQLARAFCLIARDGQEVFLRLIIDPSIPVPAHEQKLYHAETIAIIKEVLEKATKKHRWQKSALDEYRVMSKTGTANMLIDGEYDPHRNMFTCAGIIERGSYQRVLVVFIKDIPQKNVYAATIAAPLFDLIAEKIVIHDRVI